MPAKNHVVKSNPRLNFVEKLLRPLAAPVRRVFGDMEKMQITPEKAAKAAGTLEGDIRAHIKEGFKEAKLFCYPPNSPIGKEAGWAFKPIIGMENLKHGRAPFALAFAHVNTGKAEFAAFYFPITDRMIFASRGEGVYDTHKLRVSPRDILDDTCLAALNGTSKALIPHFGKAAALKVHTRKTGCLAEDITDVCAGRADVLVAADISPLEALIAELMVREAGGFVSDWKSGEVNINTREIVAASAKLHGQWLKQK
jgi:myo-inositol-1(or 4)-monophosphatase